jgi:phospholipid/cholesterol/gamma-HCH transport system substrate-binding protein
LLERGKVEVRFSLDAGRWLPASTAAALRYRNLVGQRYIALAPGAG